MVKCKYCGKEFETQQGLNIHIGKKHPEENKNVECDYCGKKFHKMSSRINEHNFCSMDCMGKWQKGKNNPNYKEKIIKICKQCGKEFKVNPSRDYREFCSEGCYSKWLSKNNPNWKGGKVTKTCEQCGKQFKVYPCKKDEIKFCSRECMGKWRSENIRGENHPRYKSKITKVCEQCGKEFKIKPSKKDTAKFCSKECYNKWMSKHPESYSHLHTPEVRKKISEVIRKSKIVKTCKQCKEEFKVYPSKEDRSEFCSRECLHKWRSENIRGENHPNWKPKVVKICKQCKRNFKVPPSDKDQKFCSQECYNKWMKESGIMEGENNPAKRPEVRKKISEISKKRWKDDSAYRRRMLKSFMKKPTSIEQKFIKLCEKFNLPYKYVGAGDFWIENMNPDFVNTNGKKVAVEILGDYWHTEEEFKERKEKFKKYGWKCIGIWGHEIKNMSDKEIAKKIENFDGTEKAF